MNNQKFNLHDFILHSNEIDKQYSLHGEYLPGRTPGEPLYDRTLKAWDVCKEIAKKPSITVEDVMKIHETLTEGIDFFEYHNASGRLREVDVRVGYFMCPPPHLLPVLMDVFVELWNKKLQSEEHPLKNAYFLHDVFESIHPFIDGNGRTGRLLLNTFLMSKEQEPIVIYFIDRFKYYKHIQMFHPDFKPLLLEASDRHQKSQENKSI